MKRVLIISPYFPPTNAADMQRIRMSLPYFGDFGWEAEIITVHPKYSDLPKDKLLLQSIPTNLKVHQIQAFSKKWTSRLGLGSLALRSLIYYKAYVNNLLRKNHFDLIYFSTTQFPVCILGAYWKRKFGVPYVIDMQDPWHSQYYLDKPRSQRPKKHWLSYRLNKYLEPIAMRHVSGLISVSESYIKQLEDRYPRLGALPAKVITFGYFEADFKFAKNSEFIKSVVLKEEGQTNLVYIGRGGFDMQPAIRLLFIAFKNLLSVDYQKYHRIRFHFIGTSYAPKGQGKPTILPVAEDLAITNYVIENTDRISFYETIKTLKDANGLIIPGSDDPSYTASKLYPYILAKKPLLGIFNSSSSAFATIKELNAGISVDLNNQPQAITEIQTFITNILSNSFSVQTDFDAFERFGSREMTRKQCELFDTI